MTPHFNALITRLQHQLNALGDGRDCRSDNEKAIRWATYNEIQKTISGLRDAPADLERATAQLVGSQEYLAAWLALEAETVTALAASPELNDDYLATTTMTGREIDAERDRQTQLHQRLHKIHEGTYLVGPDTPLGQRNAIEEQIEVLTQRRDRAQRALDGWIAQAEMLVAAAVTT